MEIPAVPTNLNDFALQAKNFVAKAKAAGKSDLAIGNTIEFIYGLYQQQANDFKTELTDVDGDGVAELVDMRTGDLIKKFSDASGDVNEGLSGLESNFSSSDVQSQLPGTNQVAGASSINLDAPPLPISGSYEEDIEKLHQRRKAGSVEMITPSLQNIPKPNNKAVSEDIAPQSFIKSTPNFQEELSKINSPDNTGLYLPMTRYK
jgi:hypothetical protein